MRPSRAGQPGWDQERTVGLTAASNSRCRPGCRRCSDVAGRPATSSGPCSPSTSSGSMRSPSGFQCYSGLPGSSDGRPGDVLHLSVSPPDRTVSHGGDTMVACVMATSRCGCRRHAGCCLCLGRIRRAEKGLVASGVQRVDWPTRSCHLTVGIVTSVSLLYQCRHGPPLSGRAT